MVVVYLTIHDLQVSDSDQDLTYTEEEKQEIKDALEQQPVAKIYRLEKIINPDNPDDFIMHPFDSEGNPIYPTTRGICCR